MSLALQIDTEAWRAHLRNFAEQAPGLVPVAKGNGYGYGLERLAQEATLLSQQPDGPQVLAVGTQPEVATVRAGGWGGDVVVLTPWSPFDGKEILRDEHVISTIARLDDLAAAQAVNPRARVVLEVMTSMRRHGLGVDELQRAAERLGELRVAGWTIHLPMVADDRLREARALTAAALAAHRAPLWLSHLTAAEYDTLRDEVGVDCHLRVGTKLWLGAPRTRRTTARVLDMHRVRRGERVGYWQRRMPSDGWVVVLSGGTANGIALEAPTSAATLRQRAITMVSGSMEALGFALSPYTLAGKKRFFVEPPHMQSSLVFLPGAGSVAVGDEIPVEVRLTTVTVDEIRG
ncbi:MULTISPECIES: alanine racemase [unclassified Luteococcus]|uniref:alanine racemase n=1 Tax=unclassified Luteococcus TaxID=2639923 RepID=UPI00313CBAA5